MDIRAGLSPPELTSSDPEDRDRFWMARALEMARLAQVHGEVPVGAVITWDDVLLAESHNRTVTESDPTGHAEIHVLREAGRRIGDWRLTRATLYVTLEPCSMCAGALVLSRVRRVVFGALDPKAGMAGSLGNLLQDPRLNHSCDVTAGVLAEASATLLRDFFQARRSSPRGSP